ncbi:E1-E2 ATPase-domain-containing protein [Lentinula edodes]|uniref:E1-E2 ATPase-domain-containing protein n=1 Tax=Lentinula edodes TaxID=5353 RepID=UPI001E8D0350|nr:E1-E2 ATPase-domain-containing protein [Lentinula edodes]KAH7869110.1 E1-E2 ATPase-domain-containing protein [Lentinula edodes]
MTGRTSKSFYRHSESRVSSTQGERVTVVHISNPSLQQTIASILAELSPPPFLVETSIVLQSVKVYHDPRFSDLSVTFNKRPSLLPGKNTKYIQNCRLCQEEESGQEKSSHHLLPGAPPAELSSTQDIGGPFKVTLSIAGMTCASCSNTITNTAKDLPGVIDLVVSLLDHSASAVVESEDVARELTSVIDDCGFEATVMNIQSIKKLVTSSTETNRTVSLKVDGMHCQHCPPKIAAAIERMGSITIVKPNQSHNDPILTISYRPTLPSFTIRHILQHIRFSCPEFQVSIHHAPTIEDVSRNIQRREQQNLLLWLLFTMSLVPDGDSNKAFFMKPMWTGNTSRAQWALFFLATPVMFYSAAIFHRRSMKQIHALWKWGSTVPILKHLTKFGSMNLLVSSGVSVAYFSSIALFALAAVQPISPDGQGDQSTYFDSVVLLTMFLLIGRYLESYSKARTADAISSFALLKPVEAYLLTASDEWSGSSVSSSEGLTAVPMTAKGAVAFKIENIPADMLELGDIVRVSHGSSPPADGMMVSGTSGIFDESSLTGESEPVRKENGDIVYVGTINRGDVVHVSVVDISGTTMLDNIMEVVRGGQTRRAPMERIADIVTNYFIPVVTLLAISTWIIWLALGESGKLSADVLGNLSGGWPVWSVEFAIAVFVVACHCGIDLAAPTAILVGSGLAAKYGLLSLTKWAPITTGKVQVSDVKYVTNSSWNEEMILGIIDEMESTSSHPLAIAIREFRAAHTTHPQNGSSFRVTVGRGLFASFQSLSCSVVIGNEYWMQGNTKSIVFVAAQRDAQWEVLAIFGVADLIRPEASNAVAAAVGIPSSNVIARVLPQEKAQRIQWLQRRRPVLPFTGTEMPSNHFVVGMVGDGINDAPALTSADVGIAIGSGSDVAISSASFILLSADLNDLLNLIDLSMAVIRRIKFNFLWAAIYNIAAILIAAGVIYPAGRVRLDTVWASLAMALSLVSVISSSLLLKLYKPPKKT